MLYWKLRDLIGYAIFASPDADFLEKIILTTPTVKKGKSILRRINVAKQKFVIGLGNDVHFVISTNLKFFQVQVQYRCLLIVIKKYFRIFNRTYLLDLTKNLINWE